MCRESGGTGDRDLAGGTGEAGRGVCVLSIGFMAGLLARGSGLKASQERVLRRDYPSGESRPKAT